MEFGREGKADPNNANWMISFGDLLTLLVCFFLAMMSERWRRETTTLAETLGTSKEDELIQSLVKDPLSTASGIVIAHETYGSLLSELPLYRDDIVIDVAEPSARGTQRLRAWASAVEATSGEITVEACSFGDGAYAWKDGQRLAEGIRRNLETASSKKVARIRSLGSYCDAVESKSPTTAQVAAVVRLIRVEKQDG